VDDLKILLIDQAKAHPLAVALTVVVLGAILGGLALFGAISGHLDPDAMPTPRTAALVRIGRRIGVVFQGSRTDFVQLWSGQWPTPRADDRPTDPPGSEPPTPRVALDASPALPPEPDAPRAG
jgi:hypothetical protein